MGLLDLLRQAYHKLTDPVERMNSWLKVRCPTEMSDNIEYNGIEYLLCSFTDLCGKKKFQAYLPHLLVPNEPGLRDLVERHLLRPLNGHAGVGLRLNGANWADETAHLGNVYLLNTDCYESAMEVNIAVRSFIDVYLQYKDAVHEGVSDARDFLSHECCEYSASQRLEEFNNHRYREHLREIGLDFVSQLKTVEGSISDVKYILREDPGGSSWHGFIIGIPVVGREDRAWSLQATMFYKLARWLSCGSYSQEKGYAVFGTSEPNILWEFRQHNIGSFEEETRRFIQGYKDYEQRILDSLSSFSAIWAEYENHLMDTPKEMWGKNCQKRLDLSKQMIDQGLDFMLSGEEECTHSEEGVHMGRSYVIEDIYHHPENPAKRSVESRYLYLAGIFSPPVESFVLRPEDADGIGFEKSRAYDRILSRIISLELSLHNNAESAYNGESAQVVVRPGTGRLTFFRAPEFTRYLEYDFWTPSQYPAGEEVQLFVPKIKLAPDMNPHETAKRCIDYYSKHTELLAEYHAGLQRLDLEIHRPTTLSIFGAKLLLPDKDGESCLDVWARNNKRIHALEDELGIEQRLASS